jgi:rfaE bifunctional protein nucleotidyltransferase chain/domain
MIVDFNEIEKICNSLRGQNKKIVFTNGCFDILHRGHIEYLTKAKEFGDVLIVGLNSDTSVKRLKGKDRPINPESDRARILDALKPVDYIVIFEEDTPLRLIQMVKPDVLVKGGDYKVEEIVGSEYVMSYGGKVEIIPFVEGKSTTKIIQKIKGEGK